MPPPRFLMYMLQNLNKLNLKELNTRQLPQGVFNGVSGDLNLLLDTSVTLIANYKPEFEVNMNAVLNAPNIELALS